MDLVRPAHAGERATVYNTVIPQRFLSRATDGATVGLKRHRRSAAFGFLAASPVLFCGFSIDARSSLR
jgi:hypothetical protein